MRGTDQRKRRAGGKRIRVRETKGPTWQCRNREEAWRESQKEKEVKQTQGEREAEQRGGVW